MIKENKDLFWIFLRGMLGEYKKFLASVVLINLAIFGGLFAYHARVENFKETHHKASIEKSFQSLYKSVQDNMALIQQQLLTDHEGIGFSKILQNTFNMPDKIAYDFLIKDHAIEEIGPQNQNSSSLEPSQGASPVKISLNEQKGFLSITQKLQDQKNLVFSLSIPTLESYLGLQEKSIQLVNALPTLPHQGVLMRSPDSYLVYTIGPESLWVSFVRERMFLCVLSMTISSLILIILFFIHFRISLRLINERNRYISDLLKKNQDLQNKVESLSANNHHLTREFSFLRARQKAQKQYSSSYKNYLHSKSDKIQNRITLLVERFKTSSFSHELGEEFDLLREVVQEFLFLKEADFDVVEKNDLSLRASLEKIKKTLRWDLEKTGTTLEIKYFPDEDIFIFSNALFLEIFIIAFLKGISSNLYKSSHIDLHVTNMTKDMNIRACINGHFVKENIPILRDGLEFGALFLSQKQLEKIGQRLGARLSQPTKKEFCVTFEQKNSLDRIKENVIQLYG